MKIAILTTDNRDHYRTYAAPAPTFGTAPAALLAGFAEIPGIEVHVVSCVQQALPSPEKIAPNIYYHSLVVPKLGWMRTLYSGCVRATRKKLREIQPDIVHGQGTERNCALAAVRGGFPNVLTIHGNMKAIAELHGATFGSFHWLAAKLETSALKQSGGVFCNSAYTENLVAPRAKKIWRVPNALRPEFFSPLPPPKTGGPPVLLNVGVIQPRKRQTELLAMVGNLHRRGFKLRMLFAGDLPGNDSYGAAFARELAVAERAGYARHLGTLTTAQIITAMDDSQALVHFPTEEAFGLATAEALARNLKFFGSAVGGGVEIAGGAEGAELFPADDFVALENAVARWLEDGCPRPQNAAATMRARYHPAFIARRHLEIYREVLQKP